MNLSGGNVALAAGNNAGERFWRKGAREATKKRENFRRFAPSPQVSIVRKLIPGTASGGAASFRVPMLTLFHHPLCPHSRYVRLILGEYGIGVRLVEERFWERRQEFLLLNPAGELPVLVSEGEPPIPGAAVIAEYIEETCTGENTGDRLLPQRPGHRAEVRRLANWFNDKFHAEVSRPLVTERVFKRHMTRDQGGGPPDTEALRAARHNIRYHVAYIGWLVRTRDWLAGDRLSLADLAAAAHLSATDYLGEVPWNEDEVAKNWYARVKSRPSFRAILADTMAGLPPSKSYVDLDF
jgi:glutathione S-transferase